MATENPTLAGSLEAAVNTVDSVLHGLQEIAQGTEVQHALWAFSNALQAAQPALESALAFISNAAQVNHE